MSNFRHRLTYANVMSTIAVFCLLGGGAYAASALSKNEVKSKHIKPGAVKTSDLRSDAVKSSKVANGSLLGEDFAADQLPQGPQGPQGTQGPQGPGGEPATALFAVVAADGTLVRGSGVTAAGRPAGFPVGAYQVAFNQDVTNCALIATIGRIDSQPFNPDEGEIGTAYRDGAANAVFVKTRGSAGAEANRSFHLAVFC